MTRFGAVADSNPRAYSGLRTFLDVLIGLLLEVEPADGGSFEGADGSGYRGNSASLANLRQRCKRLVAGFKNDGTGLLPYRQPLSCSS